MEKQKIKEKKNCKSVWLNQHEKSSTAVQAVIEVVTAGSMKFIVF